MKITEQQLRQIIREELERVSEAGMLPSLDAASLTVLGKISRSRPLPSSAMKPDELKVAEKLKAMGLIAYDLGVDGYTMTPAGLDALGRA